MKAYSPDLRSRIVAAVDAGMSKAEAARRFDVALSSVKRYVRRQAATGPLDPTPRPGRTPLIRSHQLEELPAHGRDHAAASLDEHCALWKETHGTEVSRLTMSRAIRRAGFTRTKGRWVPVNGTSPRAASGTAS
jgi:transposase